MATEVPVKHDEIIEPNVFQNTSDSADILLDKIAKLIFGFKELAKITGKKLPLTDPKSLAEAEQMSRDLQTMTKLYKGLTDAEKAHIQVQMQVNKQKADFRNQLKGEASAYQALQNQLNAYRQTAKDLLAIQAQGNKLTAEQALTLKEATEKTQELDTKLKTIDATLGQHQRNVGNYGGALDKTVGKMRILSTGVNGLLGIMAKLGGMIGLNTEAIEGLEVAAQGLKSTTKELSHIAHLQHLAHEKETEAAAANTKATEENTKVKKLSVATLSVWLVIAAAVAAITYAIIEAVMENKRAEEERTKAVDGSIIKNKELREEHNKMVFELRRLDVEYSKVTRKLNDYDAGIQKLKIDFEETFNNVNIKMKEKLEEGLGFWEGFGLLWKKGIFNATKTGMEKRQEIISEYEKQIIDEQKKKIKEMQIIIEEDRIFQEEQLLHLRKMQIDAQEETTQNKIEALKIEAQLQIKGIEESNAIESTKAAMIVAVNEKLAKDILRIYKDIELHKQQIDEQIFKDKIERQKRVLEFNAGQELKYADLTISNDVELANKKLQIKRDLQLELDSIEEEALLRDAQLRIKEVNNSIQDEGVKAKMILEINVKLREDLAKVRETSEQNTIKEQEALFLQLEKYLDEESKREIDNIKKNNAMAKREKMAAYEDEQKLLLLRAHSYKEMADAQINYARNSSKKQLDELDALYEGGLIKQDEYERKREIIVRENENTIKDIRAKSFEEQLNSFAKYTDAFFDGLEANTQRELDANERKMSELDRQIAFQQQLFLNGQANTYTQLEEQRAKALAERDRLEKKAAQEKEARDLAEIFMEFLKEDIKDGAGINAGAKALAQTLAVKGLTKLLSGNFAEGIEDFKGRGGPKDDANIIGFSTGESVVTAEGTDQTPGLVTAVNKKGFVGAKEWAIKHVLPGLPAVSDGRKDVEVAQAMMSLVYKEFKLLNKNIEGLPDMQFKENVFGELVRLRKHRGIIEQTTVKQVSGSYAKK